MVFLVGFSGLGGVFELCRIAAIVLVPFVINKYSGCVYAKRLTFGLTFFYLFCILSLLWTPDKTEGVKELFYYAVHIVLFLEIIVFARYAKNPLKSISNGWLLAVLFCSAIAYWELTTGKHLDIAQDQRDYYNTGVEVITFMHANATFSNYNNFVTFLCFALPWLVYILKNRDTKRLKRTAAIVAIVSAVIIILFNASRGGLVFVVIMAFIFIFLSVSGHSRRPTLMFLILLVGIVYYLYSMSAFAIIEARSSEGGLFNGESRFEIWGNALRAFGDTYGLGTGVGSMHKAMAIYSRGGITITHNVFLEILLQYGLIVEVCYLLFLWRQFKCSLHVDTDRKLVLFMALLGFPVYGIISSGYLLYTDFYVLMATIFVFANYERIKLIYKNI